VECTCPESIAGGLLPFDNRVLCSGQTQYQGQKGGDRLCQLETALKRTTALVAKWITDGPLVKKGIAAK